MLRVGREDVLDRVDWDLAANMEDAGLLKKQKHPDLPLFILNYTAKCQYERAWTPFLLQCRGLVCDEEGTIWARPFPKFFNDTELDEPLPWHLTHDITEKLDGSLIIAFMYGGRRVLASRGSFVSEQVKEAERIWEELYPDSTVLPGLTYLFEVLYPQNRIVVDYGARRDLVFLTAICMDGHWEYTNCADTQFHGANRVHGLPYSTEDLRRIIRDDQEGYVVHFYGWGRVKVKGAEYMRLHRLLTGVNARTIWEYVSQGKDLDEVLDRVPDEFAAWVKRTRRELNAAFDDTHQQAVMAEASAREYPDRKSQAAYVLKNWKHIAPAVFLRLDGRSPDAWIWKKLYPAADRPFTSDEGGE